MIDHKQTAKAFRSFLKANGIKSGCDMTTSCGSKIVRVFVPAYDAVFTSEQIHQFCTFALSFGLTFVRGSTINPHHESELTGKQQWNFYL